MAPQLPEEWTGISRPERVCVGCSKAFEPGDELFSALYLEGDLFLRRDRCPACWGPAKGSGEFSFWRRVVPEPEDPAKKKRRIDAMLDPQVLFDVFKQTSDDPDPRKRRFRFVLSLMLVRRKKLRFVSIAKRTMADGEQDALVLRQKGRGARLTFDVVDVRLSEDEAAAAQEQVAELLALSGPGEVDDALAAENQGTSLTAEDAESAENDERRPTTDGQRPRKEPSSSAASAASAVSEVAAPAAGEDASGGPAGVSPDTDPEEPDACG